MGDHRLLQGKRIGHHNLDLAVRHQSEGLLQLFQRHRIRTDDLKLLENHQAGIEMRLAGLDVTQHHQPPAALEGVQSLVQRGAAHDLQRDVHPAHRLLDLTGEVKVGSMNDGLGAPGLQCVNLRLRASHRHYVRAHHPRQLHGMNTHTAAGAGNQDRLPRLEPYPRSQRVHRRAQRAGGDRRGAIIYSIRHVGQHMLQGHKVLGVPARQLLAEESGVVATQRGPAVGTESAPVAIDPLQTSGAVAGTESRNPLAHLQHGSGHLMPQNSRQLRARQVAQAVDHVVETHAAGAHPQQHLARSRPGLPHLFPAQVFRRAELMELNRLHAVASACRSTGRNL